MPLQRHRHNDTFSNLTSSDMNLSFSGCGFLGIYHVGAAAAIKEYAPDLLMEKITGSSAGALVACAMMCGCCLGQATTDTLKLVIQARQKALGPLHPSFSLVRLLRDAFHNMLPKDAHEICTGRLFVSMTRFADGKNVVASQFDNKAELIDALICSAFIPFYCGTVPPTFRGVRYIDGGMSDNQPRLDGETITVSPWSGESDICPADDDSASFLGFEVCNTSFRFTARNLYRTAVALFPPHPEVMSRMCRQGFEDALRYLAKNDLIACARCISVRSYITVPEESIHELQHAHNHLSDRNAMKRSFSSPAFRKMHGEETECDTCKATAKHAPRRGLPHIVRTTLDDALAPDRSWLGFLWSFRAVRLMKYLALPWLLPIDITYIACVRLLEWLPSMGGDAKWLAERATRAIRFIMDEIDTHRHLYSARFTCQLAITELQYTNNDSPAVPTAPVATVSNWDETEMNFGFSVDMNTRSRPVRHIAGLVRDNSPSRSGAPAKEFAHAAENLEWAGIQQTGDRTEDELDTFASIVEFTRQHESLMAYYYLDENNQVKVTEIFGVNDHDTVGPLRAGLSRPSSRRHSFRKENERTASPAPKQVTFHTDVPEEDSGWSSRFDEENAATRDACCSPVQQLSRPKKLTRSGSNSSLQRTKRSTQPLNWLAASSDSDDDQFFVPDRRQRTVSQDYEAESSSDDL